MFKGGLGSMMKKAQEMQENMKRVQEELGNKTVVGESGAGAVKVTMNGHYACEKVEITEAAMQEEKELLEALIAAAVRDATQKVAVMSQEEMRSITNGMDLPAGFKMPF